MKLANPADLHLLEPHHPASLDTIAQQNLDRPVLDRCFVDTLLKLSGMFSAHIIINDAQLLDHAGLRAFFLQMSRDPVQLASLLTYLRTPYGGDGLGLGPVVVCSEPVHSGNAHDPFSLIKLLERKLGIDGVRTDVMEFSSLWERPRLAGGNKALSECSADNRLAKFLDLASPSKNEYSAYLNIAGRVWDEVSDVTRIPYQKMDFSGRLRKRIESIRPTAMQEPCVEGIKELLRAGKITVGSKEVGINRSSVRDWLGLKKGAKPSSRPLT